MTHQSSEGSGSFRNDLIDSSNLNLPDEKAQTWARLKAYTRQKIGNFFGHKEKPHNKPDVVFCDYMHAETEEEIRIDRNRQTLPEIIVMGSLDKDNHFVEGDLVDGKIPPSQESHIVSQGLTAIDVSVASGSESDTFLESAQSLAGFKFVGQVFDAEAREAAFRSYPAALEKARAILNDLFDETIPVNLQLKNFHEIKRGLVEAYHEYSRVTAALTCQGEPLRKPEEILAWDECALDTVELPLAEWVADSLSPQQKEFYRFFVEITVLFDILLDDAAETLKSYNTKRLSLFVEKLSAQRLIHQNTNSVDSFEGYTHLSEDEQAYVRLVEHLTILLDRAIDALCDLDAVVDDEHRVQIIRMRELMRADRRDLVRMVAFAAELDDMIHDVEGARRSVRRVFEGGETGREITHDQLPTRAEMNKYTRRNIFFRFMIMGRHIQLWRNMSPKARSKFNFEVLQSQMEVYGSKLESLGNSGNDIGTLPKELREGTFINSILAKALEDEAVTINDLTKAQEALNAMSGRKAMGLLGEILNDYYSNMTNVNWSSIRANHSDDPKAPPVIDLMQALLKSDGAFVSCLKVWDDELGQLSADTSEMRKLYDINRHTQVMVEFLMRYIQASLRKLKL